MSTSAGETQRCDLGPFRFYAWSVVIGGVGALGTVVFRGLIALFHNLPGAVVVRVFGCD